MEEEIGKVKHYFSKIGVGVIVLTSGSLRLGDRIHIKGKNTDFAQEITSMQIEHDKIEVAEKGASIGMKTDNPVHENDVVYKIVE